MKNKDNVVFGSYMYFGGVLTAFLVIGMLASIALIVMDIVLLTGENKTSSPVIVGVSLGAAVIILVAVLTALINSRYVFTDDTIVVKTFIFTDRVKFDDVDGIKQDEKDGTIYVHATPDNRPPVVFRLNLPEKSIEKAKGVLLEKCNVGIDTFKIEKKKK